MPAIHHLDVGINYEAQKGLLHAQSTLNISLLLYSDDWERRTMMKFKVDVGEEVSLDVWETSRALKDCPEYFWIFNVTQEWKIAVEINNKHNPEEKKNWKDYSIHPKP
ncbi:hypothetical protein BT96DRAFT_937416 [Gymnopus androsaceus JB14]|uniref:Uncharacterized protein n=1 Tax=Gymnopus androsaceus JB14 TaxID=1447944 RepID=A0A6A4HZE2_9AGAR|nr:hypothetical protein BT96DRAFT_937416 [Gymnopus androsaceus JB14]